MVDYELFKHILQQKDAEYIEHGDIIDNKTLNLLAYSNVEKVKRLFKKSSSIYPMSFDVEIKCSICGKYEYIKTSKTQLYKLMQDMRNNKEVLCLECQEDERHIINDIRKNQEENNKSITKEKTDYFIDNYLNPEKVWPDGMRTYEKINSLKGWYFDKVRIRSHILSMKYDDFLLTPYWKAIAEQVKKRADYKCQICGKNTLLNVHHRTYDNHGMELYYQEDLICLCKDCHEIFHDKLKEV